VRICLLGSCAVRGGIYRYGAKNTPEFVMYSFSVLIGVRGTE